MSDNKIEVIRCKECIFFTGSEFSNVGYCTMCNCATRKDGYCHRAEKESEE